MQPSISYAEMWQVAQMKYTYSLRCAGGGGGQGSLLTLLLQQHRIKGCECVLNIHRVSLTGVDTGTPHSSLTC